MTVDDIDASDRRMWEYHTKDNPHKPNDVSITLYGMLERMADKMFGVSGDWQSRVRKMEYVQYHWIRLAVEAARRNKYYCGGIQFWMYNDCWPASGWSIVDYYGYPKAGYYAMRDASKGVVASIEKIEQGYRIWVCNDLLYCVEGELDLRVQPWVGEPVWTGKSSFHVEANSSEHFVDISEDTLAGKLTLESVLVCDLNCECGRDRAFYYSGMPYEMTPPPAKLAVQQQGGGASGTLVISTDNYARVVTLDADLDFSDNYFDMLPGESRVIAWKNPRAEPDEQAIGITCWNT